MGGSNIEVGVIHNMNCGRKLGSPSWNSISIIEVKSFYVEYKVRHQKVGNWIVWFYQNNNGPGVINMIPNGITHLNHV